MGHQVWRDKPPWSRSPEPPRARTAMGCFGRSKGRDRMVGFAAVGGATGLLVAGPVFGIAAAGGGAYASKRADAPVVGCAAVAGGVATTLVLGPILGLCAAAAS